MGNTTVVVVIDVPPQDMDADGHLLFFWNNDILLCQQHTRGMRLQPFTVGDRQEGYGSRGCPFCPGGELAGTYLQYPSQKTLTAALCSLPRARALDERDQPVPDNLSR